MRIIITRTPSLRPNRILLTNRLCTGQFQMGGSEQHPKLLVGTDSTNVSEAEEESSFCNAFDRALDFWADKGVGNITVSFSKSETYVPYFVSLILEYSDNCQKSDILLKIEIKSVCDRALLDRFRTGGSEGGVLERFRIFDSKQPKETSLWETIIKLIEKKNISKNSEIYKNAGITRSTFSKLIAPSDRYQTSKGTIAALAIGLKLDLEEAEELYRSAGFYLGKKFFLDRVIRFFILQKNYDIDQVNEVLYESNHPPIGAVYKTESLK